MSEGTENTNVSETNKEKVESATPETSPPIILTDAADKEAEPDSTSPSIHSDDVNLHGKDDEDGGLGTSLSADEEPTTSMTETSSPVVHSDDANLQGNKDEDCGLGTSLVADQEAESVTPVTSPVIHSEATRHEKNDEDGGCGISPAADKEAEPETPETSTPVIHSDKSKDRRVGNERRSRWTPHH